MKREKADGAVNSSSGKPLITIGITCYREGEWILECWNSVLQQTDSRWTAVLVMDGTGHRRTQEIFHSLKHPKLEKYAMAENAGPYPARNKAFQLTKTPYHFYLDADDRLLPESISLVLDAFRRFPEAGFVYGDRKLFGGTEKILRSPKEISPWDLVENKGLTIGSAAYKKAVWEKVGGFAARTKLSRRKGDYDFRFSLMEAGIKGKHCGGVMLENRSGHRSVSSNSPFLYHETHELILARHPKIFSNKHLRSRFRSIGYKRSAVTCFERGEKRNAAFFIRQAWCPASLKDIELWVYTLKLLLPFCFYKRLRNIFLSFRHGFSP